ncbi:MAG: flagellar protein FlgN [Spirochaetes bacterium]|nr:flagellar protein FlgN [Spirochaetota bacterium]
MEIVVVIERILQRELELYQKVYMLEEQKGEAIIRRNGILLEKLSFEQEKVLSEILEVEADREKCIAQYQKEMLNNSSKEITLQEILHYAEGDAAKRIRQLGNSLKELLYKIQALAQTNEKLARDRIEMFALLLKEIKSRLSLRTGYNKDAVEHCSLDNPLVINRTA